MILKIDKYDLGDWLLINRSIFIHIIYVIKRFITEINLILIYKVKYFEWYNISTNISIK